MVKPGAPYKDGDVVLMVCPCYEQGEHYHARYYRVCHGKKYAFKLSAWQRGGWSNAYTEAQRGIIIGPVVKMITKGATSSTLTAAENTAVGKQDEWPFGVLTLNRRGVIVAYSPTGDRTKIKDIIGKTFTDALPHAELEDFDYEEFLEGL